MLFNSPQFVLFFTGVVFLHFAIPHRWRWMLLLAASAYFYMCWKPEYILLLLVSISADYYAALEMEKRLRGRARVPFLVLSLAVNLGLLFAFKYFNFVNGSLRALFDHFNIFYGVPALRVLLPVGISFYTFQALSYTIDVFRGEKEAERHFGIFAVYILFFPQLVAGPIERSTSLMPQFRQRHDPDERRFSDGLRWMAWGYFKKMVVADRLGLYVSRFYNNPSGADGIQLLIATYFFAFQIFCDFSGYSDIAIGAAKILGFDLMENFKRPYFARSIREFWSRWHISLSTWFRDYLYIPLGGNRCGRRRWQVNLFTVFLISGLWHGANWTFVVWGALHGFYILFSLWTAGLRWRISKAVGLTERPLLRRILSTGITFHLVLFSWVFFRSSSLPEAGMILSKMGRSLLHLGAGNPLGPWSAWEMAAALLSLAYMETIHFLQRERPIGQFIGERSPWLRWSWYYGMVFSILIFGVFQKSPFIYFQF